MPPYKAGAASGNDDSKYVFEKRNNFKMHISKMKSVRSHMSNFGMMTLLSLLVVPLVIGLSGNRNRNPRPNSETAGPQDAPYKNPELPVEERVRDLVGRMTVAEKARQLDMYSGSGDLLDKDKIKSHDVSAPADAFDPARAEKVLGDLGAGSIHDLYPSPELYNRIQTWVIKSNRLGIPALFIEEGLHGYSGHGETVLPQSVNLATTWNTKLAYETGEVIGSEARANGVDMLLAPVLDVAREPRWGRVEEDFGEDPYLSGRMAVGYVRGMEGNSLATDSTCIAEPKHFAGYGSPEGGLNIAPTHAGQREVRMVMLKPFEAAVREGHAMGIMASYNGIDGLPNTDNPWLFNEVLRKEWGFSGFVLSDLGAIRQLYNIFWVAPTKQDAIYLAMKAGVDMQFYDFPHDLFQNAIIDGVKDGKLPEAVLDSAVTHVLRVKFMLGLFDHPYIDTSLNARVSRSPEHLEVSLEVARQSMCLLKNAGGLLPLKKDIDCIAVIGPNADSTRLGDYSGEVNDRREESLLSQIKEIVSPATRVLFADGSNIADAVDKAREARVAILGMGESDLTSGENRDRSELNLPGNQEELLEAVSKTGVPIILVLQNGRPLAIPWAAEHVPAMLEAWYPGEFGGRAIAETIFGDNNPAGRLTITFPRNVGQLPDFYNYGSSKIAKYIDVQTSPQFPFGFGLSYTTFRYDSLQVGQSEPGGEVLATFQLTNTGRLDGDEVAQLYEREEYASVETPVKSLVAFARVHIKAGETTSVSLHVRRSDLEVWGADRKWEFEPGHFTFTVGGSSEGGLSKEIELK